MTSARVVGRPKWPIRVAIADDSGLLFSDDWREGWTAGFRQLGCEVERFDIAGLRGVQRPRPFSSAGGLGKLVAGNILKWQPHLVWCHHGRAASNDLFLEQFRKNWISTAVYLCDEPYEVGETAKYSPKFTFAFTMDPMTVEVHTQARDNRRGVFYLPACADTSRFTYKGYRNRTVKALFLGNASLVPRPEYLKPVEKLVDGAQIKYWPQKAGVATTSVSKASKLWIPWAMHPELYSTCLVGLNVHRDPGITLECFKKRVLGRQRAFPPPHGMTLCEAYPGRDGTGFWNDANVGAAHVNPRFYEMASCGTCVVSDAFRSELDRQFPCAPQASDPQHFLELVMYYLNHQEEAEEIGRQCSVLISKRHSYRHRAAEVLIRTGLMELQSDVLLSSLGAPEVYLTPQDWPPPTDKSWWARTGRSERWSPASGLSWTRTFGDPSRQHSLDVPTPWLS